MALNKLVVVVVAALASTLHAFVAPRRLPVAPLVRPLRAEEESIQEKLYKWQDEVTKGAVQYWNLVEASPRNGRKHIYDVAMCLEVLEHIPAEFSEAVLKTITAHV